LFELRIAEVIEGEAVLSQKLIEEGFLHAFKAGELIQEVKSMLHSEEALEQWLEQNCSKVERQVAINCLKLFNGETVKVEATTKEGKNQKRERG
jgi:hypothetical protein